MSWNANFYNSIGVNASRSTWACELKFNMIIFDITTNTVTLHVSVWVEIKSISVKYVNILVTLHVSVWVEMTMKSLRTQLSTVTLHVSVWVEIKHELSTTLSQRSRSTWACELKFPVWPLLSEYSKSRSTWACELKLRLEIEDDTVERSRSTWACELKFF